jgi:methylenetetrahydrofolate dehydrogenase (NADP+)/methenyltetrahydrofolate cyclohydrolase
MPATIINGKGIAQAVLANLRTQIEALGHPLHLAAVFVGDDPALKSFVALKQKAAQSVGITFSSYLFDGKSKDEVIQTLQYLAADDSIDGIFIELPVPSGWDADELTALVPIEKDVDALRDDAVVPAPAVLALQYVLHEHSVPVSGQSVAVVGQGRLIGKPITTWLKSQGAQVYPIDITTEYPASIASQADIVISGVGKPGLITGEWIKEDALVVDFGYADGVGDVELESVKQKASLLTPVPGGMGPLVIAAVLENLLTLAQR